MIVRAVARGDPGSGIAYKCALIDAGCTWETLCNEQARDYEMMLYCVRGHR